MIRFIRLVLLGSQIIHTLKWNYALCHITVTYISYSRLLHSCLVHMYAWYTWYIIKFATFMFNMACTFGNTFIYRTAYTYVSVSLRVRLCVCAFHWSGSSLFHQINVSSSIFAVSLNDFVCYTLSLQRLRWDDVGLKLIHKTLSFVKAISSKSLAML